MKHKKQSTTESWAIANGEKGCTFYTDKPDRTLTAMAAYYKRKIKTERLVAVLASKTKPVAYPIIKVTLLT